MPRTYVLFGSGDWAPWADSLFADLATGSRPAAVIAAGQVDNGPTAVAEYRAGAAVRLARSGIAAVDVPLLSNADADRPATTKYLDDAAFLYVLGGGPRSTVDALRGSLFWNQFLAGELPYVGSSGGSMMLGRCYPPSIDECNTGLAVFPDVVIAAHWNELTHPWQEWFLDRAGDSVLVGLDVDAALVGDGNDWVVHGPAQVHVRTRNGWQHHQAGTRLHLSLQP